MHCSNIPTMDRWFTTAGTVLPFCLDFLVDTDADDDAGCQCDGKEYESAAESVLISFAEIDTRIAHSFHDASATE